MNVQKILEQLARDMGDEAPNVVELDGKPFVIVGSFGEQLDAINKALDTPQNRLAVFEDPEQPVELDDVVGYDGWGYDDSYDVCYHCMHAVRTSPCGGATMSDENKPWATTYKITVLSMGPVKFDNLSELDYFITDGGGSGKVECITSREVSMDTFFDLCDDQGTDPEFFGIEVPLETCLECGNEINTWTSEVYSTFCGTFCEACFNGHIDACEICGADRKGT